MMAMLHVGTPEINVAGRRNGLRGRRQATDARASRKAISLRTLSARSVVTGSQRLGRTSLILRWHPGCRSFEALGPWFVERLNRCR